MMHKKREPEANVLDNQVFIQLTHRKTRTTLKTPKAKILKVDLAKLFP